MPPPVTLASQGLWYLLPMQVFCDFDGTITNRDTIVFLTETFGAGLDFRRRVLNDITSGRITVAEAIRRELFTVRATWEEAVQAMQGSIVVEPGFDELVQWCRETGIDLTVLSSGMEPVVRLFLNRWNLPIVAHPVEPSPDGWRFTHLEEREKEKILEQADSHPVIYIGDGTSDVAAVDRVDRLFTKQGRFLEQYCKERGIAHTPYRDFHDVVTVLAQMAGQATRA